MIKSIKNGIFKMASNSEANGLFSIHIKILKIIE